MTTITFHLGRALARRWGPGDEIVITELDHHANADTWRAAAADRGLTIRAVRSIRRRLELDWDRLRAAGHAADEAGGDRRRVERRRHDQRRRPGGRAGEGGRRADLRRRRALRAARAGRRRRRSAATSSPARPTSSTARTLGVLYGRRGLVEALDAPKLQPAPDDVARAARDRHAEPRGDRRRGCGGATSWPRSAARPRPADRRSAGRRWCAPSRRCTPAARRSWRGLWTGLGEIAGRHAATAACPGSRGRRPWPSRVAGRDAGDVAAHLAARGVFVSHGDFYAIDRGRAARAWPRRPGPRRLRLLHDRGARSTA